MLKTFKKKYYLKKIIKILFTIKLQKIIIKLKKNKKKKKIIK